MRGVVRLLTQGWFVAGRRPPRGSLRALIGEDVALDRAGPAVLVVGAGRQAFGCRLDVVGRVAHRDRKPGGGEHLEIIGHVAKYGDLVPRKAETLAQPLDDAALVNARRDDVAIIRLRAR